MADDEEPIARRTRSQTAAIRSANAETAARQRATNQRLEVERRNRIGDARAARAFVRTGPNDVIANMTDAARSSITSARITRISDNLENEIQRIRNAATNTMQNVLLDRSSRTRRITIRRRRDIINARRIMDVNISSLYNISQELYAYLNLDQMLYFARNSITENYYFRKLELAYGTPTIDKFNQLCQDIIDNIPITSYIPGMAYRYDIDYYCQIINFMEEINEQLLLVNDKARIKNTLINELMNSINNEKITVNNLISHLSDINDSSPNISREISETIRKLRTRRDDLNAITRQTITRHFEDLENVWGFNFENKEPYLDSYIHITSETNFFEIGGYFSEKTWKPMGHLQPFIFMGPANALKELKKLGFRTFAPFIDESYDNELDPELRFKMIMAEIERLSKMDINEIHNWYKTIFNSILLHNQNVLFSNADYMLNAGNVKEQFKKLFYDNTTL